MNAQQAQAILTTEVTRTSAGWKMHEQGIPSDEIRKRVEIRVDNFNAEFRTADISIRIDGGEWKSDGRYLID